jgi:hypothetical protein
MSYAFTRALKEHGEQSYVELLNNIRDILENEYSQKPQLSSSHPMGVYPSRCTSGWYLTNVASQIRSCCSSCNFGMGDATASRSVDRMQIEWHS